MNIYKFTLALLFALFSLGIFASNTNFLTVDGQVTCGTKSLKGATVSIAMGDIVLETVTTDKHGYFKVSLEYGKKYYFTVMSKGHNAKLISISTKAPKTYEMNEFKFDCKVTLNKLKRGEKAQITDAKKAGFVFFDYQLETFAHRSKIFKKDQWCDCFDDEKLNYLATDKTKKPINHPTLSTE